MTRGVTQCASEDKILLLAPSDAKVGQKHGDHVRRGHEDGSDGQGRGDRSQCDEGRAKRIAQDEIATPIGRNRLVELTVAQIVDDHEHGDGSDKFTQRKLKWHDPLE